MKTEKFVDFVKNVRLAHGFTILECLLTTLTILNHVSTHLSNQLAGKFFFSAMHSLKDDKFRLQELEKERKLTGTNDFHFLIFIGA